MARRLLLELPDYSLAIFRDPNVHLSPSSLTLLQLLNTAAFQRSTCPLIRVPMSSTWSL